MLLYECEAVYGNVQASMVVHVRAFQRAMERHARLFERPAVLRARDGPQPPGQPLRSSTSRSYLIRRCVRTALCCVLLALPALGYFTPDVATVASPLADTLLSHVELFLPLDTAVLDESDTVKSAATALYWDDTDGGAPLNVSGTVTLSGPGVSGGAACFTGYAFIADPRLDASVVAVPKITMGAWVRVEDMTVGSTVDQPQVDHRYDQFPCGGENSCVATRRHCLGVRK